MFRVLAVTLSLAIALTVAPFAGEAQQAVKVARIGFLSPGSPSDSVTLLRLGAFRQGLRELGYVDGQNIAIEFRWADGKYERLPGLAAELVRLRVDIIVTYAPPAIQAAKNATATIPIVMAGIIDPVATGFVASLSRPGGNITGLSMMAPELAGKQLELVKEILPGVKRVALLGNPLNAGTAPQVQLAQEAARALGLQLQSLEARDPDEIDRAFATMSKEQAGAVIVLTDALLVAHATRIADLAAKHRVPAVYSVTDYIEVGGLMSYGGSVYERYRRTAVFVDRILRGAKPADLPVEQPTRFELIVNLRTARGLSITIPPSVLARADRVVQ
jgi:putative ABC transport system substrate-binding protein